jgi:hypothetical protein
VLKNTQKSHQIPPGFASRLGDKKTRAPNITSTRHLRFEFLGRVNYQTRAVCQLAFTSRLSASAKQAGVKLIRPFRSCKRFFNYFLPNQNIRKTNVFSRA